MIVFLYFYIFEDKKLVGENPVNDGQDRWTIKSESSHAVRKLPLYYGEFFFEEGERALGGGGVLMMTPTIVFVTMDLARIPTLPARVRFTKNR